MPKHMPSDLTARLFISYIDEWGISGDEEGICYLRRHTPSVKDRRPKQASA